MNRWQEEWMDGGREGCHHAGVSAKEAAALVQGGV